MTPSQPTAILLGPSPTMVRAVHAAGARSLVLAAEPGAVAGSDAPLTADASLAVEWRDHPRLLGAINHFADSPLRKGAGPRAAVFGFSETGALVAARANEALGLPGNPHAAVAYLTDKAALRDRVNQFAVAPVRFERCDRSTALVPAAERVGFPCVAKPRTGSGGRDVHQLHDTAQAHALARQLAPEPALIVEEYLPGPEYAVAAHSRGGRHTVLAIARKHTTGAPDHAVTGYDLPAGLDRRTTARIQKLVESTLTAAGHRVGPSHTEVVLTDRGPALIEAHAHPGGERLAALLALATGTDPYALAVTTTLHLPQPRPAARDQHAGYRRLSLPRRAPQDARRAEAARAVPGVVSVELGAEPGSHVPAATSRAAGHGVVTAAGDTAQEVLRALREAADRLTPLGALSPAEELSAV